MGVVGSGLVDRVVVGLISVGELGELLFEADDGHSVVLLDD